jgi:hypothetical protein
MKKWSKHRQKECQQMQLPIQEFTPAAETRDFFSLYRNKSFTCCLKKSFTCCLKKSFPLLPEKEFHQTCCKYKSFTCCRKRVSPAAEQENHQLPE